MSLKTPLLIGVSAAAVIGLSCLAAVNCLRYSIASVRRSGNYIRILLFVDNPIDRTFLQTGFRANIGINGEMVGRINDCTDICIQPGTRTEIAYDVPLNLSYNPAEDFSIVEGRAGVRTRVHVVGDVHVGRLRIPVSLNYIAL